MAAAGQAGVEASDEGGFAFLLLLSEAGFEKLDKAGLHGVGGLTEGRALFGREVAHLSHELGKLALAAEEVHTDGFQFGFGSSLGKTLFELAGQSIELFEKIHVRTLSGCARARLFLEYEKGCRDWPCTLHGESSPKIVLWRVRPYGLLLPPFADGNYAS